MAKKHKREAATRARLGRHAVVQDVMTPHMQSDSPSGPSTQESSIVRLLTPSSLPSDQEESNPMGQDDSSYGLPDMDIALEYESDWECGYDGGINHQISGDETDFRHTQRKHAKGFGICQASYHSEMGSPDAAMDGSLSCGSPNQ